MTKLKYVVGDVREPLGSGNKLVCHCCNDLKKMGTGVALALLTKWPAVRSEYVKWPKETFELGNIQIVKVENDIGVVNLVGQHDIKPIDGVPPGRYDAVEACLKKIVPIAKKYNASLHFPFKFSCDRAGGDWAVIEAMLIKELCEYDMDVTIYDIDNLRGQHA